MANDSLNNIFLYVNQNSQVGQAASEEETSGSGRKKKEVDDYYKAIEKKEKSFQQKRREEHLKELEERYDTEEELVAQLEKEAAEIEAYEKKKSHKDLHQERLDQLKEQVQYGVTLQERADAERQLKQQEAVDALMDNVSNGINSLFTKIKNSGKEYADYVENIETRLIGTSKDYDSITSKLDKVFSMNVFFNEKEALDKVVQFLDEGIAYNVELRASLDLVSEKIAKTFNALDSTLTRLIKVQQSDSTQARLGMESLLQSYLNSSFENTEYLKSLSDQVSALLLETSSQKTREGSVEFEYAVQKWLGSMSSVGVSDSTILALATGLGYLGSGNISELTSNSALQSLIALSVQKGSGTKSYGEMLTNGLEVEDVSAIMTGFYNLVSEISDSGNLVAMNQYANLFGLTMSDITSVLNLTAEEVKSISQNMATYEDTISQVNKELSGSKLLSRTSYSEMIENLENNIMTSIGLDMAGSIGANVAYLVADLAAGIVEQLNLGTEIHPWGIGASVDLDLSTMIKGGMVTGSYLSAILSNISALSSIASPNLKLLGGDDTSTIKILGGTGSSGVTTGTTTNQVTYVGRTDNSSVMGTVSQQANEQTSSILTKDVDEESKKMEKLSEAMLEIADNVEFIVQLLNINGIKVRSVMNSGDLSPSSKSDIPKSSGSGVSDFYGGY